MATSQHALSANTLTRLTAANSVFAGKMQMGTGTAPRVAGNGNHLAGHDESPPTNQHLGKVAIADGVTTVTEGTKLPERLSYPTLTTTPDNMA